MSILINIKTTKYFMINLKIKGNKCTPHNWLSNNNKKSWSFDFHFPCDIHKTWVKMGDWCCITAPPPPKKRTSNSNISIYLTSNFVGFLSFFPTWFVSYTLFILTTKGEYELLPAPLYSALTVVFWTASWPTPRRVKCWVTQAPDVHYP